MFLNQDCSTAEDADWKLQDPHITATNNDKDSLAFFSDTAVAFPRPLVSSLICPWKLSNSAILDALKVSAPKIINDIYAS